MRCPSLRDLPPPPPGKFGWPWTEETPRLTNDLSSPRVSIVTPSYNQAKFIEETIRSVLLQGYPNLEYIIMDGGSTDGSVDLIRKYEPWLEYWISERDDGQTHAINKGWEHATGEILAYINSDDYYLKGAIASAVDEFQANPRAGIVYGTATVVDETGKELRLWKGKLFDLKTMLTVGSIVPQPTTFFSRHALQSVGYLDEKWQMIMDYELCIRVGLQLPTVCLPIIIAKFRDHLQSKSHQHFQAMANELIDWLETFSPESISPKQLQAMKRAMMSRVHYEWALNHLANRREPPSKALGQLTKSILHFPQFALKRPMDTAYIVKEIFLAYLMAIRNRMIFRNAARQATR